MAKPKQAAKGIVAEPADTAKRFVKRQSRCTLTEQAYDEQVVSSAFITKA